jgi:multidrug efflux pump subunit AcrA (membrane-fusion protein)
VTLKSLRRRFGAQAPRVAVRPHVPWYLRWLGMLCVGLAVSGLLLAVVFQYGQSLAGFEHREADGEQRKLAAQNLQLAKVNKTLKSELAVLERELHIERATKGDLAKQIKGLSHENSRLKEDIALLQSISDSGAKRDGVSISSIRVEPNSVPGEYTYRIVLVQTGSRAKPFQGNYQLVVNLVRDGKPTGITVPEVADNASNEYKLSFRVHQRIDGTFKVAPGAEVRSVQVRVFQGGTRQPKIMRTVTVS